jgi:hypothetical protein
LIASLGSEMLLLIFLYLFSVLNVEYEPFSSGMAVLAG